MRQQLIVFALLASAAFALCGCGDDSGSGVESTAPKVTATLPADGATEVSLNTSVSITFSEGMDEATVDSIYVSGMTVYDIEYDDALNKATVYIDSLLEPETSYEVTVSSYCMDTQGENLASDYTFDFTTGVFGCGGFDDPFAASKSIASAGEVVLDHRYRLMPSCGGDANMHYFKFTLDEATKITTRYMIVDADTTEISWRFAYLRADGQEYTGHGSGPDPTSPYEYESAYSFLPGTYYVKMGKTYDTGHTAIYEFVLETSEPCQDDAYEDNDFFDQATPVSEGSIDLRGCSVDKDYCAIDLSTGESLTVTLSYDTPQADYVITTYNPSENQMSRYQRNDNPFDVSFTAATDGTYYIEVFWWRDGSIYSLDFDITGP